MLMLIAVLHRMIDSAIQIAEIVRIIDQITGLIILIIINLPPQQNQMEISLKNPKRKTVLF